MSVFDSLLSSEALGILVALAVVTIAFFKWKYTYWEKRGLETLPPTIPFGNTRDSILGKRTSGEILRDAYSQFRARGLQHGGFYSLAKPSYIPVDPEIIKLILLKDFQHFVNHGTYCNEKVDPLGAHLFHLRDEEWKNLRVKLTPTFTSGKMKMMFPTLADCAVGLKDIMESTVSSRTPLDIKEILARFTTDIIGSCAFGLECNSLKDPDAEFRKYGRRNFEHTGWERAQVIMKFMVLPQALLHFFGLKLTKPDVEKFFLKAVKDTVEYREKNNIFRKDFMHLLIQLKNKGTVTDDGSIKGEDGVQRMTLKQLSAQAFVFFLAGFETSSTAMTFALYELASNPDIQDKLRDEIRKTLAKHDNKLTYDAIMDMSYLDNVINESLRKYPPVPALPRICTKDYVVPGTEVKIEKGTSVTVPIMGLHYDPKYYPDPEKFDPDRFLEENKRKRHPFTFLPFGEGPRICIGLRFAMMQSKVGLITILKDYKVKLNIKTKVPLVVDPRSFIPTAKGGIWLDVEKAY